MSDVKDQVLEALKTRDAEIKSQLDKAHEEIALNGKMNTETKAALDKISSNGSELQERVKELELRAVQKKGDQRETRSVGEQFVESEDMKNLASKGRGSVKMNVKTVANITSATSGTGGAGGALIPQYLPGIVTPQTRKPFVRDLIPNGRTNAASIDYVRETGFQNFAAGVAEGGAKPQSDLSLAMVATPVRTLAHWMKASIQILADLPQLQTYIDGRLTYGLKFVEDVQLLMGDGTGANLLGLVPQATAFDNSKHVSGDTYIDTLLRASTQLRVAEFLASGIVMNPLDWEAIQLTKDTQGRYIWGNPGQPGTPPIWGLPVVVTNAMPASNYLVGAFDVAAQIFDREDANVQVSTEDADNFTKNMVTIRAEERLALAVFRPQSFVYGSFTTFS